MGVLEKPDPDMGVLEKSDPDIGVLEKSAPNLCKNVAVKKSVLYSIGAKIIAGRVKKMFYKNHHNFSPSKHFAKF